MEDCRTPTFTTPREFKFNITPTAINPNVIACPDVRNIMASRRSFTPVNTNFRSPGLSPIYKLPGALASPVTAHHSSSFMEFKKPILLPKSMATYTASPNCSEQVFLSPCPSFGNSFSSPSCENKDICKSPQLDESKSNSVLNQTLNIKILLKTLGLEHYCENFERAGIDYQTIADFKSCDLKSLGIKSDEDRNCIMQMFQNTFST